MKKFKYIVFSFIILISSNIYAKQLITTCGVFPINIYNVAIVGNSHASYMSNFVNIDNDMHSIMLGNHSIGGDDLLSYGLSGNAVTSVSYGKQLIGIKGDCKGWIHEFINDSPKIDAAICWFGSNSLYKDTNKFIKEYKNFIDKVIAKNSKCRLILMEIPYTRFSVKTYNHSHEHIDEFNNAIEQMVKEYNLDNITFERINFEYNYVDRVHLSKESYEKIFEDLVNKYDLTPLIVEKNTSPAAWFYGWKPNSWVLIDNQWKYRNGDTFVTNTWIVYEGDLYYLDENGNWTDQVTKAN